MISYQIPAYWAEPMTARIWLRSTGWQVGEKRAVKGTMSIPAPQKYRLYDLHDVSCEMSLRAVSVVMLIKGFARESIVAGSMRSKDALRWFEHWELMMRFN